MIPVQHIHPMLVHFPIVLVFVLAAFVIVIDVFVSLIEKRLLVWRPETSESRA